MRRNQLRVLFIVPIILGAIGAADIFGTHAGWPSEAQAYFQWYLSQPLSATAFLVNRAAVAGLIGIVLSTIGLLCFWSPARYLYLAALLLSFSGEVTDVPVLVGGWVKLLEAIAQTLIGVNLALIFTAPGASHFHGSRFAA